MMLTHAVEILGVREERFDEILSDDALEFIARLEGEFAGRRADLLDARRERRAELALGRMLDFLPETRVIREDPTWRVAPIAPGLADRRVEITGPTDRKMTVNALNSGARVWLADFEDANSPTWHNMIAGHVNLIDALERRIDFSLGGKRYVLGERLPTIVVRPRGWHLVEKHITIDGRPVSASLVDFGLYFFHCARRQLERGSGPYFYLPKLENHREARLWNDVFCYAQDALGIPRGTIRATVLIETLPAAFEMEEILYELRDHSAGLNAGRWDYIFSTIKCFRNRGPSYVLPDRADITMTVPFMRAYTELLVKTCHRRGAHAIGGMAAFIPSRRDADVNAKAIAKVRADKEREAGDGFDGSWVAHPDLVALCAEVFDTQLGDRPHQIARTREDVDVTNLDLLAFDKTPGRVTEAGLRSNVSVALRYLDAWLSGNGAAGIDNLMEDVATAEIARSQVWQWIHNHVQLAEGPIVTRDLVARMVAEEYQRAVAASGKAVGHHFDDARALLEEVALAGQMPEFLTLPGMTYLRRTETASP
jgi:malate synthase